MKTNAPAASLTPRTHEGGTAGRQTPLSELERAISTCLLWENTFYEKGNDIAARIADLCVKVKPEDVAALAVKARRDMKLRHVPLFLVRQLARLTAGRIVGDTLAAVIQRPDELGEFVALYWKEKKQPLSAQVKRGLALAFGKFSEYQLAKWNRPTVVKLRDVLFLCHAKPKDAEQDALWKRLIAGELTPPDTWEVALSGGADKKTTWERLLAEKKLGYMALLMNLRNMAEAKVEHGVVEAALRDGAPKSRALPFRFITAAKHAPQFAGALSDAMVSAITARLGGDTAVVVDVSGSMDQNLSAKSQLSRWEAAGALAVLFRECAASCRVFTFSNALCEVANYRGLALVDGIARSQQHGGTYLARALAMLRDQHIPKLDRLVVVTDEQAHDGIVPAWAPHAYLINVAGYKPGLDTSQGWKRLSGWSERVVDWMAVEETGGAALGEGDDS